MVSCRIVYLALWALAVQSAAIENSSKGETSLQPAKEPATNPNTNSQAGKKSIATKKKSVKKSAKKSNAAKTNAQEFEDEYDYEDGYEDYPYYPEDGAGYDTGYGLLNNAKPVQESAQGLANLFVNALGTAVTKATQTITGAAKQVIKPVVKTVTKSDTKPVYYPNGDNKPVPSNASSKTPTTTVNLATGEGFKPIGPLDYVLMLKLVNTFRKSNGKTPLKYNKLLNKAAQLHSKDQRVHNEMTHDGSDGSKPSQRIERVGYNWESVAENVAWNQKTVQQVLKAWINSPGHRRNLLGNYKEFGVGFDDFYWTQEFGTQFVD